LLDGDARCFRRMFIQNLNKHKQAIETINIIIVIGAMMRLDPPWYRPILLPFESSDWGSQIRRPSRSRS
jgi:hypothetical protein